MSEWMKEMERLVDSYGDMRAKAAEPLRVQKPYCSWIDGVATARAALLAHAARRDHIEDVLGMVQSVELPVPVPVPDTHCYDTDEERDVWSHSPDQMRTYGDTRESAGYARGKAENAKDAERYRWLRDGNDRKESAAMRIALHCYGMEWDAAIDAALRGEVK